MRWALDIEPAPLQKLLDDTAAKWPDNPALNFLGRRITYSELLSLANRVAKGLQQLGVGPGVHVGLFLPNSPHYLITFYGILKAGGIVVNYSPLDAVAVLEHKVDDSQTDFLITLDMASLYPLVAGLLGKTRLKKLIVGTLPEMAANPDAVRAQLQAGRQLVDVPQDDRHITFAQLSDNDGAFTPHPIGNPDEAIAVLQYTGGTTGLPKGAMLTHGNLNAACN